METNVEALMENLAKAVILSGIEKKSQEAGVLYLLAYEADGLEDVEPIEQVLYAL